MTQDLRVEQIKWDKVSVRVDHWKRLQALCEQLEPHVHVDGMNECTICDEPLTDVLIRHMKGLLDAEALANDLDKRRTVQCGDVIRLPDEYVRRLVAALRGRAEGGKG